MNIKKLKYILISCLLIALPYSAFAQGNAQAGKFGSQYNYKTKNTATYNPTPIRVTPFTVKGGTQISIIAPQKWNSIAGQLKQSLKDTHTYFTRLFGPIPTFKSTVKLMDDEAFYQATGAPRWTNAMYYKEQIIIPLPSRNNAKIDYNELYRSVKHEYTHAVIHSLSNGKCPGWLDEGLAQWAEGEENPALQPALLDWLQYNRPVSLDLLQGGFTKLQVGMVPAAYAQSLFAANTMIDFHGLDDIQMYFSALRSGFDNEEAFKMGFRITEKDFEKSLGSKLEKWAHSHAH
ncbi:MAG: hypothetical protein R3A13_12785 [Bdellovibrionota bacterium]